VPTVLVVEDEWVIAEVLAMTLADAGYQVITAANGRQALASLAETRPDVIVTDTMMPILDGPGLLAALAADPAHRDIPVVLMSAAQPRTTWSAGADALIGKPFDLDTLDALVQRLLSGRSRNTR